MPTTSAPTEFCDTARISFPTCVYFKKRNNAMVMNTSMIRLTSFGSASVIGPMCMILPLYGVTIVRFKEVKMTSARFW